MASWLALLPRNYVDAGRYCVRRERLRRTASIALVVGVLLTAINQLDVILAGRGTAFTGVKCGLNFVVPFVVSNLGLLAGHRSGENRQSQADWTARRDHVSRR